MFLEGCYYEVLVQLAISLSYRCIIIKVSKAAIILPNLRVAGETNFVMNLKMMNY